MDSYEETCALAEDAGREVEKSARRLVTASKGMAKAAQEGNPARLAQTTEQLQTLLDEVSAAVATARSAARFTDEDIGAYLDHGYQAELITEAARAGVTLSPLDDRLAAFPVVVQIQAKNHVLKLDNTRLTGLRPSYVVGRIRAQQRKASTKPEAFIEVLFNTYRRLVGTEIGRGVTMAEVHSLLTLLPESKRSYGKAEFARDVFLLDTSAVTTTRSGHRVTFPASTGTKGGGSAFVVVPPDGMPKHYYGLRFEETS